MKLPVKPEMNVLRTNCLHAPMKRQKDPDGRAAQTGSFGPESELPEGLSEGLVLLGNHEIERGRVVSDEELQSLRAEHPIR